VINSLLAVINWNVDPVAFAIGAITVKWYGIMYSLSIICNYCLGVYFFKRYNLPLDKLLRLCLLLFIAGAIGARLGQIIFYEWNYYVANPSAILKIWEGGMASHGGFISMVLFWFFYSKANKQFSFWKGMDMLAIMGALTVFFMRIGNLMNSEIVGKATDVPWAFVFEQKDFVPRHPTVLYEAICYLVLFGLFFFIYRKNKNLKTGLLTAAFLLILVPIRMLLELTKADANFTQWLSLPLVVLGLLVLVFALKDKLK